ncbi:hypothetical protein [Actinacidiphila soli]|uniref:hypothetical protein n=1 Tax=Actinacidiphila soli TaxID=2487275 RepID=UPI00389915C3
MSSAAHDIAETITAALPELRYEDARDLVTTAMALAQSLWQITHPPRTRRALPLITARAR